MAAGRPHQRPARRKSLQHLAAVHRRFMARATRSRFVRFKTTDWQSVFIQQHAPFRKDERGFRLRYTSPRMNLKLSIAILFLAATVRAQQPGRAAQALPSSLGDSPSERVGERFDSALGGISLRPPAGSKLSRAAENA